MSDQYDDSAEPRDIWEIGLSVPAISFADRRVGEGFTDGIIVPVQVGKYQGKGYEIGKKYKDEKGPDGKPTGKQVVDRWPDGNPKGQTILMLLTDLGPGEFMSEKAIERFKMAADSGDDELLQFIAKVKQFGLRRFFISGGSLDPEFRSAVRASGDGKPQPCAYVSAHIAKMEGNEYGGRTKFYKVEYRKADDASRAKVAAYLATGAVVDTGRRDEGDSWREDTSNKSLVTEPASPAARAATSSGDEPPF